MITAYIIIRIVLMRCEDEQNSVACKFIKGGPSHGRHIQSEVRLAKNDLLALFSVVYDDMDRPRDADKELLAHLVSMLASNTLIAHRVYEEIALRSKREQILHVGDGQVATKVIELRESIKLNTGNA